MSGQRRRRTSGGEQQNTSSNATSTGQQRASSNEEERGGLFGWAERAGSWIGDKWDQTTETVGGWIDDAQTFAKDVKDVVVGTDMDWGALTEGRLDVETDLDEIADLMPARLAEQFQLDREGSENRVGISIDKNAGTITLRSDQIALLGLNLDAVQAGASDLRDLEIVLTDPDGELGFFDGLTDLESYDIQVKIGGADVTSLVLKDDQGQASTSVDSAALSGLSFSGKRDENGLAAEVGLDAAEVRGLSGNTAADALAIEQVKGSLSSNGEQGRLSVGRVQADGLMTEQGSGSAALEGLSATIDNRGGGLPFLDDQKDAMRARVTLDAGRISDLDSDAAQLGYLDLAAASVDYDQQQGTLGGSLGSAELGGLRGPATVNEAAVNGVDFDLTLGEHLDLDIERVRASGVALNEGGKGGGQDGGSSSSGSGGMTIGADIGNADLSDLALPGGVHLDAVRTTDVGFAKDDQGISATAGYGQARGITAGDMQIGSVTGSGVSFGKQGERLDLDLASAEANDFRHGDVAVDRAAVRDADIAVDNGNLDATAASARLEGAAFQDMRAGAVQVDDIALQRDRASGALDATLGGVAADGFRKGDVSVDSARIAATTIGVTPGSSGARIGVSTDRVQVGGLDTGKQSASGIDLGGVDFALQNGQGNVDVERVNATDFASGTFRAGELNANGANATFGAGARNGQGGFEANVTDAQLDRWSAGNIGADRATAAGIGIAGGDGQLAVGVDHGGVDGLRAGEVTAGQLRFEDLDLASDRATQALQVGLGNASFDALGMDGVSVARGDLAGLSLDKSGTDQQIGIDRLGVQGIAVDRDGTNASVGAVDATGLQIDKRADGLDVDLASLEARQLALQKQAGSGGAGSGAGAAGSGASGPGLDMGALIRSTSALVDDVDLSARVGLNQAELAGGLAEIQDGTQVDGRLVVQDGRITTDTGVDFSKPIDGPLWTTVNGAYVTDEGKLKADIGGFFDLNGSKKLNQAVGVEGNRLADIATYGDAIADRVGQSSGGSGSGNASSGASKDPIMTPGSLSVNGSASLNAGRIDAGIGGATLQDRMEVEVAMQDGDVRARIERLDAAAIAVATGDLDVSIADADLDEARVLLDQNGGDLDATLETIRLEGLHLSKD